MYRGGSELANDMKLNEEQRKRVQLLRGLAIVAVVFIHNSPAGLAQVFVRPFINFSVGLFLFLSGMLSNVDRWDPHKRIMKVAIPYVIWTIFYTVLHSIKSPASIPANFVVNLISARAAGVMYYVFVYCEFTLLIPLIDRFAKSRYKYLGFIISPVEIIVMRLLPLLMGFEMNRYLTIIIDVSCLGWFTYFYLGYMIGNYIIEVKWSVKKAVVFLGGGVGFTAF